MEIFREVRRVLRDDGTVWLNLGDCYGAGGGAQVIQTKNASHGLEGMRGATTIPAKQLAGIPWRVAFALQADGWWLRSDIIWSKPNPMPESVTDRPTKSHEYLFLLSKSASYFYDYEAIKEALTESSLQRINQPTFYSQTGGGKDYGKTGVNTNRSARRALENLAGRDRTPSGWNVGHKESDLKGRYRSKTAETPHAGGRRQEPGEPNAFSVLPDGRLGRNRRTVWEIATEPFPEAHFATFPQDLVRPCILAGCPEGGIVLDPFVGSGTAVLVAKELGRVGVGVELKGDYLTMAARRTRQGQLL